MTDISYFRDILNSDKRARELAEHDGPIVGTLCNFVPEELIVAAGAVPLRLCGGDYDASKAVEDIFPRDVCSVAKSSLGRLRDGQGLYGRVDLLVVPTSCDVKKKLSAVLSRFVPVHTMLLPPAKDEPGTRALWLSEVEAFRERMGTLTGTPIDRTALRAAIDLLNARQQAFRRLLKLRQRKPPRISGEEALYITGASFLDDPVRWAEQVNKLCNTVPGAGARSTANSAPRLLLTGAPLIHPNFKLAQIIEQAGAAIVADDICSSTQRLYQPVVPAEWTMRGMLEAVAEKYLLPSVCPCFTESADRINKLIGWIEDFDIDGVVYHSLRMCALFDIESHQFRDALRDMGVPMLTLNTDYSPEDTEQLRNRVEAFLEMIGGR